MQWWLLQVKTVKRPGKKEKNEKHGSFKQRKARKLISTARTIKGAEAKPSISHLFLMRTSVSAVAVLVHRSRHPKKKKNDGNVFSCHGLLSLLLAVGHQHKHGPTSHNGFCSNINYLGVPHTAQPRWFLT